MLRVIGDVHGKVEAYQEGVVYGSTHSVQVGDMGFDYRKLTLDHKHHIFFGGNHDNYDTYYRCPHALGDYGLHTHNGVEFFYVRGAFSIDKAARVKQLPFVKSWWEEEQLSHVDLQNALDEFVVTKPSVVFTHDGPGAATNYISNPNVLRNFGWNPDTFRTRTQVVFNLMFNEHKPKLWVFGHYHKSLDVMVDGTRFICVPELGYVDIDAEGNVHAKNGR